MEVITSQAAYDFACSVIEDAARATSPTTRTTSCSNANSLGSTCPTVQVDDQPCSSLKPSKHSILTNYAKWERLTNVLIEEEEQEKKRQEVEMEDYRRFFGGCTHDRSQERQIFEKPTKEKLLAAERFRKEGNKEFLRKAYTEAAIYYRRALLQFDYTFPDTPEDERWMNREKLFCHLNMALCRMKIRDYEEALVQCRLALQLDPKNVKALYRRGQVYLSLDDYELAEKSFKQALELSPGEHGVSCALRILHQKNKYYVKKKKRVLAKMIRGQLVHEEDPDEIACEVAAVEENGKMKKKGNQKEAVLLDQKNVEELKAEQVEEVDVEQVEEVDVEQVEEVDVEQVEEVDVEQVEEVDVEQVEEVDVEQVEEVDVEQVEEVDAEQVEEVDAEQLEEVDGEQIDKTGSDGSAFETTAAERMRYSIYDLEEKKNEIENFVRQTRECKRGDATCVAKLESQCPIHSRGDLRERRNMKLLGVLLLLSLVYIVWLLLTLYSLKGGCGGASAKHEQQNTNVSISHGGSNMDASISLYRTRMFGLSPLKSLDTQIFVEKVSIMLLLTSFVVLCFPMIVYLTQGTFYEGVAFVV